jgi:adenosylhomocysteinase
MEIEHKIEWTKKHMPVMAKLTEEFLKSKPFSGLTIGVCLHLTKETAILLLALQGGGARIIASASNPLSTQDDVVAYLIAKGMTVYGKKGMSVEEYNHGLLEVIKTNANYIIDDGADLTDMIHKSLTNPDNFLPMGGLEETTTGVTRIKNMDLKYPIIAVNDADTKHLFDNVYGTGQSTLDGIIRSTNILLAGKTFVVAGYGYCGKGLAQRARGMGCDVIVTEINPIRALQAHMDGFKVMEMKMAAFKADVIVTVTGSINVLDKQINNLKDGAIIANAGHFDIEINKKFLETNAKKVTKISDDITEYTLIDDPTDPDYPTRVNLLSEGRLVNLSAAEGHPSEVMDMSFANQALSLEYLIKHKEMFNENKVYNVPNEIDRNVALLKLEALKVYIDKETDEQINYRTS